MKKVLMIGCDHLGLGGIQSVIMSIVRELKDECVFDIVLFNHNRRDYEEEFKKQGHIFTVKEYTGPIRIRKRMDFYIRPLPRYLGLKKAITDNGPYDIIHCHDDFESGLALKAAYECGVPIRVVHSHGYALPLNGHYVRRVYEYIYRRMIRKYATKMVGCSKIAADYLYGKGSNVKIIPNAIELDRFTYEETPAPNPWSLICVGRYGNAKNQLFLVDIFNEIYNKHRKAELTLVGYGDEQYYSELAKKIRCLGIDQSVKFYPGDADVPKLLAQNNVFVLPSSFEGLGIVFIEAQAVGLKCFASTRVPQEADCGGVEFIPLEAGADKWAEKISDYIEKHGSMRIKADVGIYNADRVKDNYKRIYDLP